MASDRGNTDIAVRVKRLVRRNNTASGNPQWRLITEVGSFDSAPDAAVNYDISETLLEERHQPVHLTLNGAGKVIGVVRAGDR